MDFVRREWGAVTFVLTVIVGIIIVPLALYFTNQGPGPLSVPAFNTTSGARVTCPSQVPTTTPTASPTPTPSPSPSPSPSASTSPQPSVSPSPTPIVCPTPSPSSSPSA